MSSGGAKIYVGNLSWNTNDELLGQVSSLRAFSVETVELTLFLLPGLLPVRSGHRRSCLRWVLLPVLLCLASHCVSLSLFLLSLSPCESSYKWFAITYIQSIHENSRRSVFVSVPVWSRSGLGSGSASRLVAPLSALVIRSRSWLRLGSRSGLSSSLPALLNTFCSLPIDCTS
jgi:hypothetical protein